MTDFSERKRALRRYVLSLREAAHATFGDDAERRLTEHLLAALPPVCNRAISAYWPMNSEIGVETVLENLNDSGAQCLLPVVVDQGKPLIFRRWHPGMLLVQGAYGTEIPPDEAEVGVPEIMILPVVAYDNFGGRLGYGGGYYDRTLEILRRNRDILALGAAFSCQRVERVPLEATDQTMDAVVTEQGVAVFTPKGKSLVKDSRA